MAATVDEALEQAYRQDPEQTVAVIVVVSGSNETLQRELRDIGLEITDQTQADLGMLYGRLHLRCLPDVRNHQNVDAVSLDTPQHAF